jgi:undecaprenyl-diphosphatase
MDPFFGFEIWDYALLEAVQAGAGPLLTLVMQAATFLGHPAFWICVAAALYWRGQENRGFFVMNLVVFASAFAGFFKFVFARPRPSSSEFSVLASDDYALHSFPSGHSTIAASALAYFWKNVSSQWRVLLAAMVLVVGYSRICLGMHFPTDVLAGIGLGLVLGKANSFARDKFFHKNFKPSRLEDEMALVALVFAGIVAIMFASYLPLAGLFLGFYAGFFLFKEMSLGQSVLLRRLLAVKYGVGFAVLLGIVLAGENYFGFGLGLSELQRFFFYLFAGFWISWLWPFVFEKAFFGKTKG